METKEKLNLTMLCDFYELTMGNGYFQSGLQDRICYFDMFFRKCPDNGGFAIAAGLEQIIDYIQNLHFDSQDLAYLQSRNLFSQEFLTYLRHFHFTGDIWAWMAGARMTMMGSRGKTGVPSGMAQTSPVNLKCRR